MIQSAKIIASGLATIGLIGVNMVTFIGIFYIDLFIIRLQYILLLAKLYKYNISKFFAKTNVWVLLITVVFIFLIFLYIYFSCDYIHCMDALEYDLFFRKTQYEKAHAAWLDESQELRWRFGNTPNSALSPSLLERKLYLEKSVPQLAEIEVETAWKYQYARDAKTAYDNKSIVIPRRKH